MPVRLWHYCHLVACFLKCTPNDSSTERGMIYISISRKEDDVELGPSSEFYFLLCGSKGGKTKCGKGEMRSEGGERVGNEGVERC